MSAVADGIMSSARTAHGSKSAAQPAPFAPGCMSPQLDRLSLQFVVAARHCGGEVLDVGCGDGLATAAALSRGAHVCAVDSDPGALTRVLARVPAEQHPRLRTCVGRLPALDFTAPRFALAHIARVLHLLDGAATECTFRKCFRWLYPEGRLYLSALTPLGDFWQPVRAEFARRLALGARWPGYIPDIARYVGPMPAAPAAVHLFDERILRRELVAAGFVVEDVEWYTLPWDEAQVCCALIARCGP